MTTPSAITFRHTHDPSIGHTLQSSQSEKSLHPPIKNMAKRTRFRDLAELDVDNTNSTLSTKESPINSRRNSEIPDSTRRKLKIFDENENLILDNRKKSAGSVLTEIQNIDYEPRRSISPVNKNSQQILIIEEIQATQPTLRQTPKFKERDVNSSIRIETLGMNKMSLDFKDIKLFTLTQDSPGKENVFSLEDLQQSERSKSKEKPKEVTFVVHDVSDNKTSKYNKLSFGRDFGSGNYDSFNSATDSERGLKRSIVLRQGSPRVEDEEEPSKKRDSCCNTQSCNIF